MSVQSTHSPTHEQGQVERRDVVGFPGYRVGSDGSVWSCVGKSKRKKFLGSHWRQLRTEPSRNGVPYPRLALRRESDARRHERYVHTLVLEAFVGPKPAGTRCLHGDGDPTNNHPWNLRWGTQRENGEDARRHGTLATGSRLPQARLHEEQIPLIRALLRDGWMHKDVAEHFDVSPGMIGDVARGRTWKHV